jgi:hypothetical protein
VSNKQRGNPLFANTSKETAPVKDPVVTPAPAPAPAPPVAQPERREAVQELPSDLVRRREIREVPFEDAYKRETIYVDRELQQRFVALQKRMRKSKTDLHNEAILDLLKKYEA